MVEQRERAFGIALAQRRLRPQCLGEGLERDPALLAHSRERVVEHLGRLRQFAAQQQRTAEDRQRPSRLADIATALRGLDRRRERPIAAPVVSAVGQCHSAHTEHGGTLACRPPPARRPVPATCPPIPRAWPAPPRSRARGRLCTRSHGRRWPRPARAPRAAPLRPPRHPRAWNAPAPPPAPPARVPAAPDRRRRVPRHSPVSGTPYPARPHRRHGRAPRVELP